MRLLTRIKLLQALAVTYAKGAERERENRKEPVDELMARSVDNVVAQVAERQKRIARARQKQRIAKVRRNK